MLEAEINAALNNVSDYHEDILVILICHFLNYQYLSERSWVDIDDFFEKIIMSNFIITFPQILSNQLLNGYRRCFIDTVILYIEIDTQKILQTYSKKFVSALFE